MIELMLTKPLINASDINCYYWLFLEKSFEFSQKYVSVVLIKIKTIITIKCF